MTNIIKGMDLPTLRKAVADTFERCIEILDTVRPGSLSTECQDRTDMEDIIRSLREGVPYRSYVLSRCERGSFSDYINPFSSRLITLCRNFTDYGLGEDLSREKYEYLLNHLLITEQWAYLGGEEDNIKDFQKEWLEQLCRQTKQETR